MSAPEDPGIFRLLLDWAWAIVLALAGLLYRESQADVKDLKDQLAKTITREELDRHEEREERDRAERKKAESTLFEKIDRLDEKIDAKLDAIVQRLLTK